MITGAAKVAGVVGWPVEHSLSPLIHNAWIDALGLDAVYAPFAVSPERFLDFVRGLTGVCGLNVTLPHKQAAFAASSCWTDRANASRAVNLLLYDAAKPLEGDNTDALGLVIALREAGWSADSGPAVVIGAGGAARGAVAGLLGAGVKEVRVVARKAGAAGEVSRALNAYAPASAVHGFGLEQRLSALDGVSAVINATSAGLNGVGELPPMDAAPPGAVFMDMVYSPLRTRFLRDAAARGHATVDGLAMLIGQARPSFEAFFGVAPPPPEVIDVRALCLKALGEST